MSGSTPSVMGCGKRQSNNNIFTTFPGNPKFNILFVCVQNLGDLEFICNSCKDKEGIPRETPPPVLPQKALKKPPPVNEETASTGEKRKRPVEEDDGSPAPKLEPKGKAPAVSPVKPPKDSKKAASPPIPPPAPPAPKLTSAASAGKKTEGTNKSSSSSSSSSNNNNSAPAVNKSKKGRNLEDDSDSDDSSSSDGGGSGDWIFDCVCGISGKNFDDGTKMVACEKCQVWQHVTCNSLNKKSLAALVFVCRKCLRFSFSFLFSFFFYSLSVFPFNRTNMQTPFVTQENEAHGTGRCSCQPSNGVKVPREISWHVPNSPKECLFCPFLLCGPKSFLPGSIKRGTSCGTCGHTAGT